MTSFTFEILQIMKDVAMLFYTKCTKYKQEELTQELRDVLFKEAVSEVVQTNEINEGKI